MKACVDAVQEHYGYILALHTMPLVTKLSRDSCSFHVKSFPFLSLTQNSTHCPPEMIPNFHPHSTDEHDPEEEVK